MAEGQSLESSAPPENASSTQPSGAQANAASFTGANNRGVQVGQNMGQIIYNMTNGGLNFGAGQSTALHKAIAKGDEAEVRSLLQAGANIEASGVDYQTPLQLAINKNNFKIVEILVEAGAECETQNMMGGKAQLPLVLATVQKSDEMVRLLLDKGGADVNPSARLGKTPLLDACLNGTKSLVILFLSRGANVNHRDALGRSPLFMASLKGHEEIVRLLLDHGAATEAVFTQKRWTALWVAVIDGHENVVKMLLDKGANTETLDLYRQTPLFLAIHHGRDGIIKLLLAKSASTSVQSRLRATPKSMARASQKLDAATIKMILDSTT